MSSRPVLGRFTPPITATMPRTIAITPRTVHLDFGLRWLLPEPAHLQGVGFERLVEVVDRFAELEQLGGIDVAVLARCQRAEAAVGELFGRTEVPDGISRAKGLCRCVTGRWFELNPDLPLEAEHLALLSEGDEAPTGQVEHRGRQRSARWSAGHDERGRGGREVTRRAGHVNRRIVEIVGVATVAQPGEDRAPDQAEEDDRGTDEAHRGIDLAGGLEPGGMFGRGIGVDPLEGDQQGAVQVRGLEPRQHVFVEDPLLLTVVQERRAIARAAVQLDLAVDEARVQVEEDDEAVVEALPADAPLIHEGLGVPRQPRPS